MAPSATSPAKLVDPTTGKLVDQVTIDGQGTYTINNETGVVTFVPLKTFTGTTPVTVSLTATLGQDKMDNLLPLQRQQHILNCYTSYSNGNSCRINWYPRRYSNRNGSIQRRTLCCSQSSRTQLFFLIRMVLR